MKILFLHGRESTPETSSTAKAIKDYFTNYEVLIPDYKPNISTHIEIEKFLSTYYNKNVGNEPCVVIGISLGGYWALNLTNMTYARNVVLLNPSIFYYGEAPIISGEVSGHLIMNNDDDVVDNDKNYDMFKNRFKINRFESGGHRMTNMEKVLPLIDASVDHFESFIP